MRCLQAKKKGKGVTRPVGLGERALLPPSSEEASASASGGAGTMALVGGPSHCGDAATSSNVLVETGRLVVDPASVVAPATNIVANATARGMA